MVHIKVVLYKMCIADACIWCCAIVQRTYLIYVTCESFGTKKGSGTLFFTDFSGTQFPLYYNRILGGWPTTEQSRAAAGSALQNAR